MKRIVTIALIVLVSLPAVAFAAGAGKGVSPMLKNLADPAMLTGMLVMGLLLISRWNRLHERDVPARPVFCPWSLVDVLMVVLAFVVLQALVNVGRMAIGLPEPGADMLVSTAMTAICGGGTVALILLLLHRRYGLWPRDLGLTLEGWPSGLLLAGGLVIFIIALRIPMGQFFLYLYERSGKPWQGQEVAERILHADSTLQFALYAVFAVVAAPLWEEIAFRGFLQPFFRRYLGPWAAVTITAVIFSLVHNDGSPYFMVPVMLLPVGFALGYAFERTRRLSTSIMLHALYNGSSVAVMVLVRGLGLPAGGP